MTEKGYLHKKIVHIPIYHGRFILVISNCEKRLIKSIPDLKDNLSDGIFAHAIFNTDGGYYNYYIVLNFDYPGDITHGVIAHEANHVARFILKNKGYLFDPDNDEPVSYLIEWIVDIAYKFIQDKGFEVKTIK